MKGNWNWSMIVGRGALKAVQASRYIAEAAIRAIMV
jgi:hypothetical protein